MIWNDFPTISCNIHYCKGEPIKGLTFFYQFLAVAALRLTHSTGAKVNKVQSTPIVVIYFRVFNLEQYKVYQTKTPISNKNINNNDNFISFTLHLVIYRLNYPRYTFLKINVGSRERFSILSFYLKRFYM